MHHFWRSVQQIGKESLYFFAAVEGVAGVEPVRLTVKEFDFELLDSVPQIICSYFEKNGIENSYNSLYDARALEVIGIEGIKNQMLQARSTENLRRHGPHLILKSV